MQEGDHCELIVQVQGEPQPKITWFKDGVAIQEASTDYLTEIDAMSGICRLVIAETMVADSGNWSVRASNTGGYAESHAKVTVLVKKSQPKEEAPAFIEHFTNVEVLAGNSMTLSGRLHPGYPTPQIYWKHNEKIVHQHYHWDTISQRITLFIETVDQDTEGKYTCCVKNSAGEAISTAFCKVLPLIKPTPPTVYVPLKNQVSFFN